jgi:F0F1-type ATP synthase membrane subunit b/b'
MAGSYVPRRTIEGREKEVSDALAGADQARQALADAEKDRRAVIAHAEHDARQITDRATRDAAAIKSKADADSHQLMNRRIEEAQRAIQAEYQKAFETLRLDAASRLSNALERMLKQNLTDEQKKKYQDELLSEVKL